MLRQRKRLGEILVEEKLITDEQLKSALKQAKKMNKKLGQFLVQNGIVNESQIVDSISKQLQVEKYKAKNFPVQLELSKLFSIEDANKYQAAPLSKKGSLIKVAMTDPMDINALDSLEVITNSEVEPVICTEQELITLLNSIYGRQMASRDEFLGEMEAIPDQDSEIATPTSDVELSSLQDLAEDAPVIRLVNSILAQAVRENASDVHISPEKDHVQVRFRVDGKLRSVPPPPMSMFLPIISRFKILANMDIASSRIPQDGRFSIKMGKSEINVRASTLPTIYGENLVLRLLDMSKGIYWLDKLGMTASDVDKVERMIHKPYGMILTTGPTGSGKSTTLYSILKRIHNSDINIITLEDPVEFRMEGVRQVQLNTRAGMTFASGLRSILRQDPDVVMVGEIRDGETAAIAVQAALTGHLVLSTLHTNDAAGAVTRLVDMGIEPFLVSSVVLVTIGQRLIRRVCEHCSEPYEPPADALKYFGLQNYAKANYRRGKGCFQCMDSGYKGRTGIYEVLIIDSFVEDMIMKKMSSREIMREARKAKKLHLIKEDAARKIINGITTVEEAMAAVMA